MLGMEHISLPRKSGRYKTRNWRVSLGLTGIFLTMLKKMGLPNVEYTGDTNVLNAMFPGFAD
jgi:hypothetical protein